MTSESMSTCDRIWNGRRIVLLAVFFLIVLNRWLGWASGISFLQADDARAYNLLADAAPGLPAGGILFHHAQRFAVHSLAGGLSHLFQLPRQLVYFLFVALLSMGIAKGVVALLQRLQLQKEFQVLLLATLLLSPYTFRYYLVVPVMVADLLFEFGLTIVILALFSVRPGLLILGALLGSIGRQSMLLVIPGVFLWVVISKSWLGRSRVFRLGSGLAFSVVTILVYKATGWVVQDVTGAPVIESGLFISLFVWMAGHTFSWTEFLEHVLRVFFPFFSIASVGLGFAAARRAELRFRDLPREFWLALLIWAGLVAQPLLVNPEYMGQNQSRQAAIGFIAAFAALAVFLRQPGEARCPIRFRSAVAIAISLILTSLHHKYTWIGPATVPQFVSLHLFGCLLLAVATYSAVSRPPSQTTIS